MTKVVTCRIRVKIEMVKKYGNYLVYRETCVKQPNSKRPKIGFQAQLSHNAGQKYCRML